MSYITDFTNFKEARDNYSKQDAKIQQRLNQSKEVVYNVARKVNPPKGWENHPKFEWMHKNFDKRQLVKYETALESNTREVAKMARKKFWELKTEQKRQAKQQVRKDLELAQKNLRKAEKELKLAESRAANLK